MIRGLTLHRLDNPNDILIGDGVRPTCQNSVYPAYGNMYSFGAKRCGCSVFYRAGLSAAYAAEDPQFLSDDQRLLSKNTLTTKSGALKALNSKADSALAQDWRRGTGFFAGPKKHNYRKMPKKVIAAQKSVVSGQNLYGGNKYGGAVARKLQHQDMVIRSDQHSNMVLAEKGERVVWSLPLGDRLISEPLVIDNVVYLGSASGWVHAVELTTGKLQWSYQGAPADRRMVAFGQVESAWPIVSVQEVRGHLVLVAGRRNSFDDGIFVVGLDPASGKKRWQENIIIKQKRFTSGEAAQQIGFSGFGAKNSTHAFSLWKGDDEDTYWMLGTMPVKIPAAPN